MNIRLVDSTQSTVRRKLVGTTESELVELEQPTNTYESESESANLLKSIEEYDSWESVDLQQLIDTYEPDPNEESIGSSKPEPTMGGRTYPLRERRAPT